MRIDSVCVLGGTGFVGRHLVPRLAREGRTVRVLSRRPHRHRELLVTPGVELVEADVHDPEVLKAQFAGMGAVVNLVGILNERRRPGLSFREAHVDLPRKVVEACRAAQVERLLHMSALNADAARGRSVYLRSKGEGENRVHVIGQSGIHVTTFQPSVIFGPDDAFINRFARLLRLTPLVFPLACPDARFAPVWVGDVAEAFARALEDSHTWSRQYPLCGPREWTLRQVVEFTARTLGIHRVVIGLPDGLSRWQARILSLVPGKPFTMDNYLSLKTPSVCADNGLCALGIEPADLEAIVPGWLEGRSRLHRLSQWRAQRRA